MEKLRHWEPMCIDQAKIWYGRVHHNYVYSGVQKFTPIGEGDEDEYDHPAGFAKRFVNAQCSNLNFIIAHPVIYCICLTPV